MTIDEKPLSALCEYLNQFPAVSGTTDIAVTIKGKRYAGVSYRDSNFGNEPRLYLLGRLPACYRRSTRTAFVINGADWFVACYMPAERITPEFAPYHPCGENFLLCRWDLPNGSTIDRYELRPYNRVAAIVE